MGKPASQRDLAHFLTVIGFCVAMEVILSRFLSFHTMNMKIGFSFLPVVVAGYWGGSLAGGITGMLGDVIGFMISPSGTYFPGFTLSSFLDGVIYGYFLKGNPGKKQILAAVLVTQLCISLCLNTFWLTILLKVPLGKLLYIRLFQCISGIVIKTCILWVVLPVLTKRIGREV